MRVRCAVLLLGLAVLACDDAPDVSHAHPIEARPRERDEATSTLPPPMPGTIEACAVALGQHTPDELSATLDDLGYDVVFEDACRAARAERDRSASLCDELSVSVLRDRCRERVAIASADPSGCPDARAGEGREPLCLALAGRDPRLCAAAPTLERAVCEAVLLDGDDHPGRSCGRLPVDLRPACIARSERLSVLATGARVDAEPVEPSFTFHVGEQPERSVGSAAHGARVVYEACIPILAIGDEHPAALSLHGPGSAALRVPLGSPAPIEADVGPLGASLALSMGSLHAASIESGHVSITQLDRELGGTVIGTFTAELRGAGEPQHVEGAFTTFVRDLEVRPDGCPAPP
jgi:hypothetical protein